MKQAVFYRYHTIIVGSGAAGYNAALRLYEMGQKDIAIVTEGRNMGTSRNTGSDKQTYYKLSLSGSEPDSVMNMAQTLFDGGCMDGDIAYAEAAGSVRSFFNLVELGVPFPTNESGEYVGYKTDHDPINRGTSAGPYTSKFMTEALERRVAELEIPVFNRHLVVRLLTNANAAEGIVALNMAKAEDRERRFSVFSAANVIWATGGEAGLYRASVYPHSQSGGSGILFEAGAAGKNLTESQYGIASTKFRWNLSGSFQQALPRYLSVKADGTDEREFLEDGFTDRGNMINAIFLKGYQWPFDPRKTENESSSLIDLLIYQEEVLRGRKVFLDYTRNPSALEKDGNVDFSMLSEEARAYLENCGALQKTPIERLKAINPDAIAVYADHHIDLTRERLAISICAQHNNGGIAADAWWESGIRHLFPVGEVNGSHGVYRPGGSALNSGQVGSMRAAQKIVHGYTESAPEEKDFMARHMEEMEAICAYAESSLDPDMEPLRVSDELAQLQERMTRFGACVRTREGVERAIVENKSQRARVATVHGIKDCHTLAMLFRVKELLNAQYVYLCAIQDYMIHSGVSRSSYLVYNRTGRLPHEGIDECFRNTTDHPDMDHIQEICWNPETDECTVLWRPVRPIPAHDQWFETAWQKFKSGAIYR